MVGHQAIRMQGAPVRDGLFVELLEKDPGFRFHKMKKTAGAVSFGKKGTAEKCGLCPYFLFTCRRSPQRKCWSRRAPI